MPPQKRVLVSFGSSPVRKKTFSLPGETTTKEFEFLRQQLVAELSAPSGPKICCKNIILSRFDDMFQEDVELDDQDVIEHGDKLTATVLKKQLVSQESQQSSPKENVHNNKEALHHSGKQYQLRQQAPLSYLFFLS